MADDSCPEGARPIIVLGYQRSGTSLLAEIVVRWGAYAGNEEELMPADEYNQGGYWEYVPMLDLFRAIADYAGHPKPTITYFTIDQDAVRRAAFVPSLRREGLRLISKMAQEGQPWMWKDPALVCFLPFWLTLWDRPIFLVTVRNPICSATSWQNMLLPDRRIRPKAVDAWLIQWQRCMRLVCAQTATHPKLFVDYQRLVLHADDEVRRISAFLSDHSGRQTSPAAIELMRDAVQPQLRHRSAERTTNVLTVEQSVLLAGMEAAARDTGVYPNSGFDLPAGWSQLLSAQEEEILRELHITA